MTRARSGGTLGPKSVYGPFRQLPGGQKVALALFALIHSQFPRDSLYIIGLSDYAREIKEEGLAQGQLERLGIWYQPTPCPYAVAEAAVKGEGGSRQILLITDGEPTATWRRPILLQLPSQLQRP